MAAFSEIIPNTISAFTDDGEMVMTLNRPVVSSYLQVKELEEWLTTLEETMVREANATNRYSLEGLYFMLKTIYRKHLEQHETIQAEAPTADDLQAYLVAYSAAIAS